MILLTLFIRVLAHEAKLNIVANHRAPALANEYYYIELKLNNPGEPITEGTLTFEITPSSRKNIPYHTNCYCYW